MNVFSKGSGRIQAQDKPGETLRVEGEVVKINFANATDGFQIVVLHCKDGAHRTVKGKMPVLHLDESIAVIAKVVEDEQWGNQYHLVEFMGHLLDSKQSLISFLGSKRFRGIDKKLAKAAVDHFGVDIVKILDEDPQRISEVHGVGPKRAADFVASYEEGIKELRVYQALIAMGVSDKIANKAMKHWGGAVLEILQHDPYSLTELDGVGFRTADQMAICMGVELNDPRRVRAALVFCAEEVQSQGHCYLEYFNLIAQVDKLTSDTVLRSTISKEMQALIEDGRLIREGTRVYAAELYYAEVYVAEKLAQLMRIPTLPLYDSNEELESAIADLAELNGIKLGAQQLKGLNEALASPVSIITGGPGTGKTTLLRALCALLEGCQFELRLCAPTGRAAKRIQETTNRTAKTIHRLIEFSMLTGPKAMYNATNPLPCDVVIVDESSMLDIKLAKLLLEAMSPTCRLVLIGDADQLPSVGPGNVLRDIIKSKRVPVVKLDVVYRQAQGSFIVDVAYDIINGIVPEIPTPKEMAGRNVAFIAANTPDDVHEAVARIVTKVLPNKGFEPHEIQVLSPMRKYNLGVDALNITLQDVLNPPSAAKSELSGIREGDKVMQMRNNYKLRDTEGVFNGDIGTVQTINSTDDYMDVFYPDYNTSVEYEEENVDQLQLAYATTVHKAQGAEFPAVVLVLDDSHNNMLQRNLVYTAVTRAKRLCAIVGTRTAIEKAVKNNREMSRNTSLTDRVQELCAPKNK